MRVGDMAARARRGAAAAHRVAMARIAETEMAAGGMSAAGMAPATAARERERWNECRTGKRRRNDGSPNIAHGLFSLRPICRAGWDFGSN